MKMTTKTANLMLLLVSILWGLGFVATKLALDANVTVGFINFARGLIFVILTILFFRKKIYKMKGIEFKVGLVTGLLNFGGFITQTIGMKYTTPSNNAFITSAYIVIIPILSWLVYKKPVKIKHFISVIFCVLGMAILTGIARNSININKGDFYTLACAFFYACSIVYIAYNADEADHTVIAFMLAAVQTIGGMFYVLIIEGYQPINVNWQAAIIPLLYMGVMCSFAAQTMQIVAQKHTPATIAGLIMMLEGFFGGVFSVGFGLEPFTSKLVLGGTIIMFSLMLVELDFKRFKKRLKEIGTGLSS